MDLGRTTLVEHRIETGDAAPVRQPPRRVPIGLAYEEDEVIKKIITQEVSRE